MPFKIQPSQGGTETEIEKLRHTIRAGEGMTMNEVAERLGRHSTTVASICVRRRWVVSSYIPGNRNAVNLLVNPQDLKKYAGKNSRT